METGKVKKARLMAFEWHKDQMYGPLPYSYHLMQVVETLIDYGFTDEDTLCSGYLHDSFEDCQEQGCTLEIIEQEFGKTVKNNVWALSAFGKNRTEKLANSVSQLNIIPTAVPVKMADRLRNMESSLKNKPKLFRTYCEEFPEYLGLFERTNKKLNDKMFDLKWNHYYPKEVDFR